MRILVISTSSIFVLAAASCVGDPPASDFSPDASTPDGSDSSPPGQDADTGDSGGDADAGPPPVWTLALTARTAFGTVVVDPATGDVFVGGWSRGNVPELGITASNGDNEDALIVKLDRTGKVLWAKTWGGSGNDFIVAMTLAGSALYVTGASMSTQVAFPGASPGATVTFPSSSVVPAEYASQSFIAKIDGNGGAAAWATSPDATEAVAGKHRSLCTGVIYVSSGLFVACNYYGAQFGPSGGYAPASDQLFGQPAILQLNSLGNFFPVNKAFASSVGFASANDIGAAGGFIYVAGSTSGALIEKMGDGGTFAAGAGTGNGFVLRFPEGGGADDVVVWKSGGSGTSALPSHLVVTSSGVFVTGKYSGTPEFGNLDAGPGQASDGFIAGLPLAVNTTNFVQGFGGTGEEDSLAIALDGTASPSVWAGGMYFSSDFSFAGKAVPAAFSTTHQGFFAKFGPTLGSPVALTPLDSTNGNVSVNALRTDDANGYVLVVGTYNGQMTFDDNTKTASAGDSAGFVIRRKIP